MTIKEIWGAIEQGKKVNWSNSLYIVEPIEFEKNKYSALSYKDGHALRITCRTNYFGGLIAESELKDVYIGDVCPACGSEDDLYWDEEHETFECGSCGVVKAI